MAQQIKSRRKAMRLIACLSLAFMAPFPASPGEISVLEPRIDAAADALMGEPRLRHLPAAERTAIVRFVTGNLLFVVLHELGHGLITEMGLPVLGREEDAADSFATVAMLGMKNDFSERVLADAARGWFLHDRRDRATHAPVAFYDEHSLSQQRAYQIICYMVGSDPEKFRALADQTGMPPGRRASCQGDFSNAEWSWNRVLAPHRRTTQERTPFEVRYHDSGERYAVIAQTLKFIGLLERVADRASLGFVWRAPVTIEARSCGRSHAQWTVATRTLTVCYELAAEFAALLESYGPVPHSGIDATVRSKASSMR
jgi:hypothetical protein